MEVQSIAAPAVGAYAVGAVAVPGVAEYDDRGPPTTLLAGGPPAMPRDLQGLPHRPSPGTRGRGRARSAAAALLLVAPLVLLGASADTRGDAPAVTVTLTLPPELRVGDRAELLAEVRVEPPGPHPVLVTPSSEGPAIEVVRGRLLRADAEDPGADTLRFRIPLVARAPGDAVLRVEVEGYACGARCVAARGEARAVARVHRP